MNPLEKLRMALRLPGADLVLAPQEARWLLDHVAQLERAAQTTWEPARTAVLRLVPPRPQPCSMSSSGEDRP